jgi:4-hydroxy-tetrahydrodipicolinate synthase
MLAIGAAGLMNAVGNLAPGRVAALCEAVARGELSTARQLHFELFEVNQAIFLDTNPIPLKYMMWRLGLLETAEVRLPLVELAQDQCQRLDEVMYRAGLIEVDTLAAQ